MSAPDHDHAPRRQLILFSAFLLALGLIAHQITWYGVQHLNPAGTYVPAHALFLPMDSVPDRVVLHENGLMEYFDRNGKLVQQGHWHWQSEELVLRSDMPRWDRQIRARSTLFGPRLCMRICPTTFQEDLEERDDEIDLVKVDLPLASMAPRASTHRP